MALPTYVLQMVDSLLLVAGVAPECEREQRQCKIRTNN